MSVYTLNLRVFWPLLTCVLTSLVLLHHTHRLSPGPGPDPGSEAGSEHSLDEGPSILLSLVKLLLVVALCYLFIRYCSAHPGEPKRVPLESSEGALKLGSSRRDVLEDYYERWVHLSPHVLGHSKANVAKLVGELVKAGRANGGIPESSLAFRGDFLQVGSSYEEHKVGAPDFYDILVPLRVPRELKLEPRVYRGVGKTQQNGEGESKMDERRNEKEDNSAQVKANGVKKTRRRFRSNNVKESLREKSSGEKTKPEEEVKTDLKEEVTEDNKKSLKEKSSGEKTKPEEELKTDLKEELTEDNKESLKVEDGCSGVPQCSLEMPRRGDWVRKHRNFTNTFLRLHHPQGSHEMSSRSGVAGVSVGGGDGVYRLTPDSILRWFYPAVHRCLATVRYPFEQRCTLSLTLADDQVQLRLTPHSDYVCCHISMAIRLLPAIPLGDGIYLVPTAITSSVEKKLIDMNNQSQEKDLWTLFFPRQELRLLGWLRGRSPQPSCHLKVLQLTKAMRDLGGQALDSHKAALWRSVLSSYALKTAWLRLVLSSPAEAWEERHLVARMEDLVHSLRDSLQNRALGHIFLSSDSSSILPDSVVLPKLVKDVVGGSSGGKVEGSGNPMGAMKARSRAQRGNLWEGVDPTSLDLVSGRLQYVWSNLHRLIRLGRPQRSSLGLGRAGKGHCVHLEPGE
ncbi:hypothetical protein UPYG_G00095570 [Umbra pygmaea]|uniref:Mab-21-like HhH/H2TH-like domain-containing protein n=1 Tax=Umbra pygmaea TaxID=75934 RepID=A0ABD0XHN9_UMBPY